ncbi:MAG: S-layer homology domain-containing protein [Acutalibacter sp.]|nr:S-layer homology domain-containing protein [Acutalibacter sp.]
MKRTKRMAVLLLALVLMLLTTVPALAANTGFSDIPANAWYGEAVEYVREQGMMSGTGGGAFSPNGTMTRGMLVMVLYKHAGSPQVAGINQFTDVATGKWYYDAVRWAAGKGVVSGYSANRFGPDDAVTREQTAAILWNYVNKPTVAGAQAFADQSNISAYAVNAVAWARNAGIISGKGANRFDPKGLTTRAEMASILYRFCKAEEQEPEDRPQNPTPGTPKPNTPKPEEPEPENPQPENPEPETPEESAKMKVQIGNYTFTATLEDNTAVSELKEMMRQGSVAIQMSDYGGFEKVGSLGRSLTRSDSQTTTSAGDIVLYNGNQIVMFYGSNSWSYTRLGHIDDLTHWKEALGSGSITAVLSLG